MVNLLLATQRVESTIGITLNRLLRYFGYAGGYLVATLMGAGSGFAIGSMLNSPNLLGVIGALAGFAGCAYVLNWSRRARLYQFWSPHLSLFGMLAKNQTIPTGKLQLESGRQQVKSVFDVPADLQSLYDRSADVLCAMFVNRLNLQNIASMPYIGKLLNIDINLFSCALRDALLIDCLDSRDANPWRTIHDNLSVVNKGFNQLFRSLILVFVIQVLGAGLAFVVWYVGIDWLLDHWPTVDFFWWKLLITGLLAWVMYAAFVYPIAVNAMADELQKLKAQDDMNESGFDLNTLSTYQEIEQNISTYQQPVQDNTGDESPETE